MTIDEIRQAVSKGTGIPADLLTGETQEEILASAKALLKFRNQQGSDQRGSDQPDTKTTREQFAEWFTTTVQHEQPKEVYTATAEAEGYPVVKDGGNPYINDITPPDTRSTREKFSEWANSKMATTDFWD